MIYFLLLFFLCVHAEENHFEKTITSNLTLEADKVNYLSENKLVNASGNVLLIYQNYRITANQSLVDTTQNQLYIRNGFVMQRSQRQLKGYELDYNLQNDTGKATQVSFDFSKNYIRGKEVVISKNSIEVFDARMTVCDLDPPHYYIQAKKITIYTHWNMTVADQAVLYVGGVPLAYIPSYVVSNEKADLSQALIPEFGSNIVEGDYVKFKLGYHANEKIQGTVDLDYLSRLDYRAGFTNTAIMSNHSTLQLRVHQVGRKGLELGMRYRTLLGVPQAEAEQGSVKDFFAGILPPSNKQYPEMWIDMTHREFINLQTISLLPEITLVSPEYFLGESSWSTQLLSSLGHIQEEGTGVYQKFRFFPSLGVSWDMDFWGHFFDNLYLDSAHYFSDWKPVNSWQRLYLITGLKRDFFGVINSVTSYRHTFDQTGASPFLFDQFYQSEPYEISQELWFNVGKHQVGANFVYGLQSKDYRVVDYYFNLALHEWRIGFKWQTKINDFRLSIQLSTDY